MLPLVMLATTLLQQNADKKRQRRDLLNEQISSLNKLKMQRWGTDPFVVEGVGNIEQWGKLNRAQADQSSNVGPLIQAIAGMTSGEAGSPSSGPLERSEDYSGAKDYSGGNLGGALGVTPGGHDFSSPFGATKSSLDGDSLLDRLDKYGIDYGGRQRLWG